MRRRGRRSPAFCGTVVSALAGSLVGLLAPASAWSESLADAWQMALQNDHRIAAAAADLAGARAAESAARASRWPSLGIAGGYTRFNEAPRFEFPIGGPTGGSTLQAPIFPGDEYSSAGVQLRLPLYTGGRISRNIAAAGEATVGATDAEVVERAFLRLDVARAYIDVLRARRLQRSAETTVASLRAHESDVANMVERELVARSDLLAARVALANEEQQRVRAQNAVSLAEAAYNRRLGEPLDRQPDLEDSLPAAPANADEAIDALLARALEARSELGALEARATALALQSQAERATLLPQLTLNGDYSYFENEILDRQDFSSVGLSVTWNLFDGGQARHRSASLRHASRAAQSRLEDLRTQVELEVRQAWLDVREARARLAAAREAVAQSDENLRITRELYGAGLGTNTQVLEAIALQVTAVNNRDNATLDQSLAEYRLAHAVGAL